MTPSLPVRRASTSRWVNHESRRRLPTTMKDDGSTWSLIDAVDGYCFESKRRENLIGLIVGLRTAILGLVVFVVNWIKSSMNAPERTASFLLDEDNGEVKIVYTADTKVSWMQMKDNECLCRYTRTQPPGRFPTLLFSLASVQSSSTLPPWRPFF